MSLVKPIILGSAIIYGVYKLSSYNEKMRYVENRNNLISHSKVSDQVNHKSLTAPPHPMERLDSYGKNYPSSSRLRYNKRRFLIV